MTEKTDILVVTAHPDDAEFGVAGTVALWTAEGKQVVYVVCTNGDKGTSDRSINPEDLVKTRQGEQKAAAKILGVREVVFLGYSDQGLEDTPENVNNTPYTDGWMIEVKPENPSEIDDMLTHDAYLEKLKG